MWALRNLTFIHTQIEDIGAKALIRRLCSGRFNELARPVAGHSDRNELSAHEIHADGADESITIPGFAVTSDGK
jgi:hypothetical protein